MRGVDAGCRNLCSSGSVGPVRMMIQWFALLRCWVDEEVPELLQLVAVGHGVLLDEPVHTYNYENVVGLARVNFGMEDIDKIWWCFWVSGWAMINCTYNNHNKSFRENQIRQNHIQILQPVCPFHSSYYKPQILSFPTIFPSFSPLLLPLTVNAIIVRYWCRIKWL